MAVIKNNKTGMWEVRTYYKDLTGARKQKTKRGFDKKSEALEWERNFKLKEDQSISMSFKSFVDIYLTDLESRIKRNTFLTKKSTILTTNMNFNEWDGIFFDAVVANAIMDRVLHHAHLVPMSGKSYRLKDLLKQTD